jgi:sulfur-oxidizing protein SoxX
LSITAALAGAALFLPAVPAIAADADADAGRELAMDIGKGNCLACHAVPGDPKAVTSANIGPPLTQIRSRFPQRERLREQIRDPMQFNPDTVMPPFGKHGILTPAEIEKIIDYLYTL